MDREEILKRSRAEYNDEAELYAVKTGESWGFTGMMLVFAGMYIVTWLLGEDSITLLRSAAIVILAGYGLQKLGYGIKTRKKRWMILGILWLALGMGVLLWFFKDIIG